GEVVADEPETVPDPRDRRRPLSKCAPERPAGRAHGRTADRARAGSAICWSGTSGLGCRVCPTPTGGYVRTGAGRPERAGRAGTTGWWGRPTRTGIGVQ